MNNELIKQNQQEYTDYDTNDPEVPLPLHKIPANPDDVHSEHKHNRAEQYAAIALRLAITFCRNLWHEVLWSKAFWTFAATVVMAIATAVYAIYASRQWRAMRDSNEINRQSLIAVQRAFVTYNGVNLDSARKSIKTQELTWMFSAILDNNGATPATNKIQYFTADNTLGNEPSEEEFVGEAKGYGVGGGFGPKSRSLIGRIIKSDEFILGTFRLMDVGSPKFVEFFEKRRIFFWGWVVYRDAFPNTPLRLTEFCQEVKGIGITGNPTSNPNPLFPKMKPGLSLSECRHHNCTDEYCEDYQQVVKAALDAESSSVADPFGVEEKDRSVK